jgi:hypothetical protein
MLKHAILICFLLILVSCATAQEQPLEGTSVEVVATASEYVPTSTTITHPGHSYTNCSGSTSYFAGFHSYGDSGSISGSADTRTNCETSYTPPTETTLTNYRKVNYTIAKGEHGLYLLSCTQHWKPTKKERALIGIIGGLDGLGKDSRSGNNSGAADRAEARARGTWSECPAFGIGTKYALSVNSTSDARLVEDRAERSKKPIRLEYLASASLTVPSHETAQEQSASAPESAKPLASTPPLTDALSIGAARVILGMSKEAALSEVRKYYALQVTEPHDEVFQDWVISDKANPNELLGVLRFRAGKLTAASKHWTHENKDYSGADTAEIIYKVFSKLVAEGDKNCTIGTIASLQRSGPGGLEFRETQITCGHHEIEITLQWQSGPAYVQVTEHITNEPN